MFNLLDEETGTSFTRSSFFSFQFSESVGVLSISVSILDKRTGGAAADSKRQEVGGLEAAFFIVR